MKKSSKNYAILFSPMTMTLTKPKTSESEILHNLNDGVELALKLFSEAEYSESQQERKEKFRYLGMCLRSLKHGITLGTDNTEEP